MRCLVVMSDRLDTRVAHRRARRRAHRRARGAPRRREVQLPGHPLLLELAPQVCDLALQFLRHAPPSLLGLPPGLSTGRLGGHLELSGHRARPVQSVGRRADLILQVFGRALSFLQLQPADLQRVLGPLRVHPRTRREVDACGASGFGLSDALLPSLQGLARVRGLLLGTCPHRRGLALRTRRVRVQPLAAVSLLRVHSELRAQGLPCHIGLGLGALQAPVPRLLDIGEPSGGFLAGLLQLPPDRCELALPVLNRLVLLLCEPLELRLMNLLQATRRALARRLQRRDELVLLLQVLLRRLEVALHSRQPAPSLLRLLLLGGSFLLHGLRLLARRVKLRLPALQPLLEVPRLAEQLLGLRLLEPRDRLLALALGPGRPLLLLALDLPRRLQVRLRLRDLLLPPLLCVGVAALQPVFVAH
mmetsp:Transcript_80858/g.262177  ORF Transcript_80858/g.262177 Transcript_80858/m.262177 type:complete len:418 (+) Transcript_80858:144-1397(+)